YDNGLTIGSYTLTGSTNLFLAKYDYIGELRWVTQLTCSLSVAEVEHITTDRFGNIFIVGKSASTVDFGNGVNFIYPAPNNVFLVKFNANGKALWCRDIYFGILRRPGISMATDYQGNIVLGFGFHGTVSFSHSLMAMGTSPDFPDIGFVKYDSGGTIVATEVFGGGSLDWLHGIDCDNAGNVYALGNTWGGFYLGNISTLLPNDGVYIIKLSPSLVPLKAVGAPYSGDGKGYAISVDKKGDFVITGFLDEYSLPLDFGNGVVVNPYTSIPKTAYVVYFNNNMIPQWGTTIKPTSNGGTYPIAPYLNILYNQPVGYYVWVGGFGSVTLSGGYIYQWGKLNQGTTQFGDKLVTAAATGENYLAKMDSLGNFIWVYQPGPGNQIKWIGSDIGASCYITGEFNDSIKVFDRTAFGSSSDYYVGKITDYAIYRGVLEDTTYCSGDSIIIPYTKLGSYKTGNRFIAQLSDSSGSFSDTVTELGSLTDTLSGVIKGKIPLYNMPTSTKYRLRIVSTNPVVHSYLGEDMLRLKIYSRDTANAGPDIHLCHGQSVTLSTTGGSHWRWNPFKYMSRRSDTLNNRVNIIKPAADIEYRIIISDPISGCGPTDTDYVKIYVRPKLELVGNDTFYYCKGRAVTMIAKASGGDSLNYSYEWGRYNDPKDEIHSTDSFYTVAPPGLYRYMVVVKDGCSNPDSLIVTTIPLPGLTLTLPTDTTICPGSSIDLIPHSHSCDSSTVRFEWDNGLGTGRIKTVSPAIKTTYRVVAYDTLDVKAKDTAYITVSLSPPLDIVVNKDTTICKGNALQLTSLAKGGISSKHQVIWTADSSTWTDTGFTVPVTPQLTTRYTAILKDGCSFPDTASVTVTVLPEIVLTLNSDTILCKGQSTQLKATVTGGIPSQYRIKWLVHDSGLPVDTNFTFTVTPDTNTTYLAIVTDNCTVLSDSSRVKVDVRPPLEVSVNADTTICSGETAQIRVTAKGGLSSQYSLTWNDGTTTWNDSDFVKTVTPAVTTAYTVILEDLCTVKPDTALMTVTVRPPLTVSINAKDSICLGQQVNLKATLSGGLPASYNFVWSADNAPWTSNSNPVKHTPAGHITYKATLTDNCSSPVSDSLFVTVLPIPLADFTASDTVGCPPMHLTLNDVSIDNDPVNNQWILPGTVVNGGTFVKQTFNDPGKYDVGLIVSNDLGCSDTMYKKGIEVYIKPQANFIIKPNIKETEEPVVLVNLSKRAVKYAWSMGNYDTIYQSNLHDTTYTYLDSGNVLVKLIAENSYGCKDTAYETIRIADRLNCYIPDAFSPNSDFINDYFAPSCLGLQEYRLQVYNRWGQLIHDCSCPWDGKHQGEIVPEGAYVYIIQTTSESGKKKAFKGVVIVII
ncbi:MAG TPA: gliding motility-associated C-terminal domain-containing protein, partial [Bacteroidia bacterium]|nr:gliding motility-associated C-terminal domain-containing protein [Bacteroidia bacterium]